MRLTPRNRTHPAFDSFRYCRSMPRVDETPLNPSGEEPPFVKGGAPTGAGIRKNARATQRANGGLGC